MPATHFTAWLVNDASCLDQDNMDLTILEDRLIGSDPDNDGHWSTDSSKPTALYAITTVNAEDGDIDDAIGQAERLMSEAGWQIVGDWEATDNAYIVTVERDDTGTEGDAEAAEAEPTTTAWLTTQANMTINGEYCEVNVTEDEATGGTEPMPATQLTVSAATADRDDEAAQAAAEAELTKAGWETVGDWEQYDHGYTVTVQRA